MRSWARMSGWRRLALVATAVVLLAAAGILAAQRLHSDNPPRADKAQPTVQASDDVRPVAKTLPMGTEATISPNYRISVTDVTVYEGATERFLVATVRATYIGEDEGDPWADLVAEFSKPQARSLDETGCPDNVRATSAAEPPPLAPGDVETYPVCFDVPTASVDGGKVIVEEAFSKRDRFAWSTDDAPTEALPSPSPQPTFTQAPASRPQPAPRSQDESDTYDSDKIEEYREDIDEVLEKYEKQRDRIKAQIKAWKQAGYEGDEVDDYKEWLEDVEEAIDYYEEQRDKLD